MSIDINDPRSIIEVRTPQWGSLARLDDLIELAKLQTSTCLGKKYALAVALRVMHGLAIEEQNGGDGSTTSGSGTAGFVTSIEEGDVSESRSNKADNRPFSGSLSSTTYGQELLAIMRSLATPVSRFSLC